MDTDTKLQDIICMSHGRSVEPKEKVESHLGSRRIEGK